MHVHILRAYRYTRYFTLKNEFHVILINSVRWCDFWYFILRFTELSDYSKVKHLVKDIAPPCPLTQEPYYNGQEGWYSMTCARSDMLSSSRQHIHLKSAWIIDWRIHSEMWSVIFSSSLPCHCHLYIYKKRAIFILPSPATSTLLTAFLLKKKTKQWDLFKNKTCPEYKYLEQTKA